jgi:cysteine desulfurase
MSTATATKEDTTDISAPGFSIKGNALAGRAAYLDFQATTPMDPRVLDAMLPYMTELYGNPHSRTHTYGWETEKAVEDARENVANLIGATSKEIIFTSGATESNNMAIKGVARFYGEHKKHLITTQTEHKCVLDSFRALQSEGFEVTYLPVQTNGLIELDQLKAALRPETVLVSIMGVNNEIGVIQPLKEISKVSNAFRTLYGWSLTLASYSCARQTRRSCIRTSRRWPGKCRWTSTNWVSTWRRYLRTRYRIVLLHC